MTKKEILEELNEFSEMATDIKRITEKFSETMKEFSDCIDDFIKRAKDD